MHNAKPVFAFLKSAIARGQRTALVTVTAVTGASASNPGTHMAVAENGEAIGSFSGGCIERAVVREAQAAIAAGQPRQVRFGAGSPYIDIRLPCGGSLDLLFTPLPDAALADSAHARLAARQPAPVVLPLGDSDFRVTHPPALRVAILGHGATVAALRHQAAAYGAETLVLTPDADIAAATPGPVVHLKTVAPHPDFLTDPWTASVFVFHDHDWEAPLIRQALAQPGFFIGCMGSRKTHARRRELLLCAGTAQADVDRIAAPIGLIPSSRDPATLALSIMAQVVARYHICVGEAH